MRALLHIRGLCNFCSFLYSMLSNKLLISGKPKLTLRRLVSWVHCVLQLMQLEQILFGRIALSPGHNLS